MSWLEDPVRLTRYPNAWMSKTDENRSTCMYTEYVCFSCLSCREDLVTVFMRALAGLYNRAVQTPGPMNVNAMQKLHFSFPIGS